MAKATPDATPMRRCIGSTTFGIEAHEAPASDFPIQPSRKDGLGRMCTAHWNAYTTALSKASLARKAADGEAIPVESAPAAPTATRRKPAREAPVGGRTAKAPKPMSAKVRDARAVIAATETPAGEASTDARAQTLRLPRGAAQVAAGRRATEGTSSRGAAQGA